MVPTEDQVDPVCDVRPSAGVGDAPPTFTRRSLRGAVSSKTPESGSSLPSERDADERDRAPEAERAKAQELAHELAEAGVDPLSHAPTKRSRGRSEAPTDAPSGRRGLRPPARRHDRSTCTRFDRREEDPAIPPATSPRPLLVLGLDACDPDLVRSWAQAGELPFLARLLAEGRRWRLTSDPGLFVGSVWPTYLTGVSPTRHRRYCYRQYESDGYRDLPNSRQELATEPFWAALGRAGRRVALLDVPLLPVTPGLNGVQVVGWGAHDTIPGGMQTWPPALAGELRARFGDDPVGSCDQIGRDPASSVRFRDSLLARIGIREAMIRWVWKRERWDLLMAVYSESHCAGHQLWHLHDPHHPRHDRALAARMGDPLMQVYRAIDASLLRLAAELGNETRLLVLISHGMGPHSGLSETLDEILLRLEGVSVPPAHRLLQLVRRSWRTLPEAWRDRLESTRRLGAAARDRLVEEARSQRRCFAVSNNTVFGAVRVNLQGREPSGRVSAAEYETFCAWLRDELLALRCAESGEPAVLDVLRSADLYGDSARCELPDLLVRWNQARNIQWLESPRVGRLDARDHGRRTGDHRSEGEGWLIAHGPEWTPAEGSGLGRDLAPSLARLCGLELESVDGKPLPGLCPSSP